MKRVNSVEPLIPPTFEIQNIEISKVMRLSIYNKKNWHIEKLSKILFEYNVGTAEYP